MWQFQGWNVGAQHGFTIYINLQAKMYAYSYVFPLWLPLVYMYIFSSIGPPQLLFEQNQTVLMNVSEQVVLNCTMSSSPDPVYNWSIPDTCSSPPYTNNDSIMIFTAHINDSGEYVCESKNKYGSVQMIFIVQITSMCIYNYNLNAFLLTIFG